MLKLSYCRKREKLSQLELAKRVGITNNRMSRIETGRVMIRADELYKMSLILNVSMEELICDEVNLPQFKEEIELKRSKGE